MKTYLKKSFYVDTVILFEGLNLRSVEVHDSESLILKKYEDIFELTFELDLFLNDGFESATKKEFYKQYNSLQENLKDI